MMFDAIGQWLNEQRELFILNFIDESRWKLLLTGLGNTLLITLFATLIGIFLGIIVAAVRTTYDKNGENIAFHKNPAYYILKFANAVCKIYITIIRGTPVVVQLLIAYFIIFASSDKSVLIAIIAFGVNSGAYVAEILRGGIMSIDNGQFEAGRSLGFNYLQTMIYIVIPQATKTALPSLLNEFIALLKETSVAGYLGPVEITKAGTIIRSRTLSAFMPLIAVALIYLIIVTLLTWAVSKIEKRLRKNER